MACILLMFSPYLFHFLPTCPAGKSFILVVTHGPIDTAWPWMIIKLTSYLFQRLCHKKILLELRSFFANLWLAFFLWSHSYLNNLLKGKVTRTPNSFLSQNLFVASKLLKLSIDTKKASRFNVDFSFF